MLPPVLPLQQDDGAGGEDGVYRKGHNRPQGLPDNTEQQDAGQCRQAWKRKNRGHNIYFGETRGLATSFRRKK